MLKRLERVLKSTAAFAFRLLFRSGKSPAYSPGSITSIIVIRQHNQLGDMLCAVPLLRSLRSTYPQVHIALMTSPVNNEVMLNNRYVDEVINYDKEAFLGSGITKLIGFVSDLRSKKFDLAIVPATVSVSFTSDLFAFLSGARIRIGTSSLDGVQNSSGFFFSIPVDLDWRAAPHRHQALRNADIARLVSPLSENLQSEITLSKNELEEGKSFVNKHKSGKLISIAFHPGAGKIPNRWPVDRFAEVAEILSREFNAAVFITSGPMDEEPVQKMVTRLGIPYQLIEKKPIRAVASILAAVDLVVSNDTGIMHVGAAVGTPVLSLFGPTDPEQWAPIDGRSRYIKGRDENINLIPAEEVLRVAREMLQIKLKGI